MSKKMVIIGAGGCAREVVDILDACNQIGQDYEIVGYIVESQYGLPGTRVNDVPILGDFDWLAQHAGEVFVICGVGPPELRLRLVTRAQEFGVRFSTVIHPSVVLTRWITMGEDVVIAPGCILTNQIRIGDHVQVNTACTIAHDAVLEDFATLAPGVHIAGKVTLGAGCYIGIGANVADRVRIGDWSIVGAGSTITEDVPSNTTVVGVPGRVIKTREAGWHLKR
jgi:sugar O-acyltransferase (sialic acid O-acetyltransferase NeuD family)